MNGCKITFTSSSTATDNLTTINFEFLLGTATAPDTLVESEESINVTNFVLYLMSLAGSWFGISVVTFNPINIWNSCKQVGKISLVHHDDTAAVNKKLNQCQCQLNNHRMKLKYDYEHRKT